MSTNGKSETINLPVSEKNLNTSEEIIIHRRIINGKRAISLLRKDGINLMTLGAESANLVYVAMYGMSENYAEPVTEAEMKSKDNIEPGDLVLLSGRKDGEYPGRTFLNWTDHYNKINDDIHIVLAPRDGGGTFVANRCDVTLASKGYRDFTKGQW